MFHAASVRKTPQRKSAFCVTPNGGTHEGGGRILLSDDVAEGRLPSIVPTKKKRRAEARLLKRNLSWDDPEVVFMD
jgi:hypothetical protein